MALELFGQGLHAHNTARIRDLIVIMLNMAWPVHNCLTWNAFNVSIAWHETDMFGDSQQLWFFNVTAQHGSQHTGMQASFHMIQVVQFVLSRMCSVWYLRRQSTSQRESYVVTQALVIVLCHPQSVLHHVKDCYLTFRFFVSKLMPKSVWWLALRPSYLWPACCRLEPSMLLIGNKINTLFNCIRTFWQSSSQQWAADHLQHFPINRFRAESMWGNQLAAYACRTCSCGHAHSRRCQNSDFRNHFNHPSIYLQIGCHSKTDLCDRGKAIIEQTSLMMRLCSICVAIGTRQHLNVARLDVHW